MTELSQPNLKVSVNCKSTFNTLYHTWSEAEYNFHRVNPHWEAMTVKFSDSTGFLIFLGFASISVALTLLGLTYMFWKHCKSCARSAGSSDKHDVNDIYGTYARYWQVYNKRHQQRMRHKQGERNHIIRDIFQGLWRWGRIWRRRQSLCHRLKWLLWRIINYYYQVPCLTINKQRLVSCVA